MKKLLVLIVLISSLFPLNIFSQYTNQTTISSDELELHINNHFPRIKMYNLLNSGVSFLGNITKEDSISINAVKYKPIVSSFVKEDIATYTLNINKLDVIIILEISVSKNIVDFQISDIQENGRFKIHTLAFPNHELISICSNESNANFAGAQMFTKVEGTEGDIFQKLNNHTKTDSIPIGYLYGILSNENVTASLWTNAVEENTDNNRILKKTIKKASKKYTSLWSGSWIFRANRIKNKSPYPHIKIIVSEDNNEDGNIDWQDGAIAHREIMNNPFGSERIKELVVSRIPMNFASQATNPFSKSLDETKRIFLHTDGLGQFVLLKGYAGEGHDSNHPDYGYIGKRQGGVKELNLICNKAAIYNAEIGVHVNGTESYPEARMFSELLVNKKKEGWNWLDQSYRIDKRNDAIHSSRLKRLESLKKQVPHLGFIYMDVWYAKGSWDSRELGREVNSLGLILTTEFPQDLEYNAVWNHWAVDVDYGGPNIKGFHSQIVRFIRNHQKDTWIANHPILGGAELAEFEGWQGKINYNECIEKTFQTNLPTKYLQHYPIFKWEKDNIYFDNDVEASLEKGNKRIRYAGIIVLNNDAYLLPWSPLKEDKLYHWNNNGGTTSWVLPKSWNDLENVYLYKLTDRGRVNEQVLEIKNRNISIKAMKKTPYVIHKVKQDTTAITWGEGTMIKNGGFNSGNTRGWEINGHNATVVRDSLGQYELIASTGNKTTISQRIEQLSKGSYTAEVYVESRGARKATLQVETSTHVYSNYCNSSLWENYILADSKHGKNMQKMFVFFDVTDYHDNVTIKLEVEKGDSIVVFDDIRVVEAVKRITADSIYFSEDFENIPSGLFPFVKGAAGGANDPRVHLSERHSPFTQKGWNDKKTDDVIAGNWSLKLHENATGIIIQTIPQHLRFEAGQNYKVRFKYQAEAEGYAFILGDENKILYQSKFNKQHETQLFEFIFTASSTGNSWFGIKKLVKETSDFIIDGIEILQY